MLSESTVLLPAEHLRLDNLHYLSSLSGQRARGVVYRIAEGAKRTDQTPFLSISIALAPSDFMLQKLSA